jgi:hypothetical protein
MSSGAKRAPVGGEDPAEKPEPARAEWAKDERLALLERVPSGVVDDASVRDENGERAGRRLRAEQLPCRPDLGAPFRVMLRHDRVEDGPAHGEPAERESRRLLRAAERAGIDLVDRKLQPAHPAPDRPRVGTTLRIEVALRPAIREDDRVLVGLREVRRRMPEDEHETTPLHRARELGLGCRCSSGARARGDRQTGRRDGEGSSNRHRHRMTSAVRVACTRR